jgi:hypothetical protein
MKKMLLGLVAAFALAAFTAPVARAQGEAAGGDTTKTDTAKKTKKTKKSKKTAEGSEAAPAGGDTTKK